MLLIYKLSANIEKHFLKLNMIFDYIFEHIRNMDMNQLFYSLMMIEYFVRAYLD